MNETGNGRNRLLTNADRALLEPVIHEMRLAAPEMMGRKIAEANVQQAWCLDWTRRSQAQKILCVGCFEDTAYAVLERERPVAGLVGIDPAVSGSCDLAEFREAWPDERYDCVFACSVIEHVADDEQFIRDLCDVIAPGGTCILTCDYQAAYQPGDPLPATNVRFYTPTDVARLGMVLNYQDCEWADVPDLTGEPDFVYQGHHYSFLALAFRKAA